ncbi:cadherin-like domain-containing protein (plasmid) [Phyllobacterium sp. A18/5-2]|uniref:cadherin-like domain-containing protein n=1 Tax=Phyllobacterium sp. A18/5-2 TaxID=2978392 RepID=UPI0021CA98E8|nr:cadherin-like domain-containing protein [Phyllobacterium sp. A18/5-2]UXN66058.1 cadherin-like domain-containing protein [Phyllobacterium sp. A18/5-2]
MMIDVKGTKSAKPETDESHEHYVLKSQDKRSNAPLFFTVFLTGLALYLKSAFPRLGSDEPEEEAKSQAPEQSGSPEVAAASAPEVMAEIEEQARENPGSGGRLVASGDWRYELSDSPMIEFQKLNLPHSALLKTFGGMSFSFHAANDNAWRGGNVTKMAQGGGGGSNPQAAPVYDLDARDDPDLEVDDDDDTDEEKAVNRAPRVNGPVYLADVFGCAVALIGLSDLLRGASDPDGDALSIQNISVSSGTLIQTESGWYFDAAMLGPVTVTYQISDGKVSILQTAQFSVLKTPPIIGTQGDDILVGTNCADDIDGRDGNDNIDSRSGNDTVNGGNGNDHIVAGSGNDIILAGAGDDIVLAGLGDDQVWGGSGNDRLFGDEGRDTIFGESGDDIISGGNDDDLLFGGEGNDTVAGDLGRDTIHGDAGNDRLEGGGGNDIILGQAGADVLDGGGDDDFLSGGAGGDVVKGGEGTDIVAGDADQAADRYDGGSQTDTLDYSAVLHGTTIDLEAGTANGTEIGHDTISSFEILKAGAGNDDVQGSAEAEEIHGNSGDDLIAGAGGDDSLFGGEGSDHLSGGDDADTVEGGAGSDTVVGDLDQATDNYDGGAGIDTLDYSAALMAVVIDLVAANASGAEIGTDSVSNFEVIKTGEGADEISGSTASESIFGNGGNDTISGGSGSDTLSGGAGNDVIADGEGSDCVEGGSGDDIVQAAADGSDDIYAGQAGSDTLDYSQSALGVLVDLDTGAATGFDIGQDLVSGFEKVVTGSGDDHVVVGTNAVILEGGGGADTFEFHIPEGSSSAKVIHQILDFMVGDRIEMSQYEIFEDVIDTLEQRFEDVYGDQAAAEPLPIRICHEGTAELEQTLVEVDMDRDEHYEMTINLNGHHMLMIVENP